MIQSNITFYLRGTISTSLTVGGTFNISNDLELGLPINTGGETVSIVFSNKKQIERMTVTIVDSVCTVVTRGIEQTGGTTNTGLQRQWNEGATGYITALDFDILDKDGASNTISANNTFSGDNIISGSLNMQGEFKLPTFSDTTSRDLVYTSPLDGYKCVISGTGEQVYESGAWKTLGIGTPTPNMSETVNGTGEIATAAQRAASTSVGETGARLVVSNDALVKTPDGTPANDENKVPVLNASGKVDDFVTPFSINGLTEEPLITTGDYIPFYDTSAGENRKVGHQDLFLSSFNIVPGDVILAESNSQILFTNTSDEKKKEIQVDVGGTYKISFGLGESGSGASYGTIYVNGISVGTERTTGDVGPTDFLENITVGSGDLIQIYCRVSIGGGPVGTIQNFNIQYNTVSNIPTGTVNI